MLIPRPETELLVELAVARLPQGARVVDVGTGSGAIALALADERPDLRVTGSDVSADALAVARANGERLGLRVEWLLADGVPEGDWDAVVSNPPYVADGDAARRRRSPATSPPAPCSPAPTGWTRCARWRRRRAPPGSPSSTARAQGEAVRALFGGAGSRRERTATSPATRG